MNKLMHWEDPFAGLTSLHSHLDDIFNDFFNTSNSRLAGLGNLPAMDVYNEDDKRLVAEVHVPGFDKENIEVSVHNGVLEIKGEKSEKEENDKKRNYLMRESTERFYRRIALPKHANGEAVSAEFDDGVLRVAVPYKELPQPKRIAISAKNKTK